MAEVNEQAAATSRAAAAAEALAAEGAAVTARAVRERSGVKMSVAADVAREWNQREQSKGEVPSVPDALRTRFDAIWAEAVVLARAEHAAEREGWQQRLTQLEAERDALTDDLAKAEDALDSAVTDAERARAEAEQRAQLTADELAGERSRADRAEARAEALVEERDRLIGERDRATQEARESRKPSKG